MPMMDSASSRRIGRTVTVMTVSRYAVPLLRAGMRGVIDREEARRVNLGVALGGREGGMAEQFLDRTQVATAGQKMRGEGMAQGVRRRRLGQTEKQPQLLHRHLHQSWAQALALGSEEQRTVRLAGYRQG